MDKQQREEKRAWRREKRRNENAAEREARDNAAAKRLAAEEAAQAEAEAAAKKKDDALKAKRAARIAKVAAWTEKTEAVAAETAQRRAAKRADTPADAPAPLTPEEEAGLRNFIVRKLTTGNARPWIHTVVDGKPVYTKAWSDPSAWDEPRVMEALKNILAEMDIAGITIESAQDLQDTGLAMRVMVPEDQFNPETLAGLTKHGIALSIHEDRAAFPLPVLPKKKVHAVGFSLAEGPPKRLIRGENAVAAGAFLTGIETEGFAQGIDQPPVKQWVSGVRPVKQETPLTEVEKQRDHNVKNFLTMPPANYEMHGMSWKAITDKSSHKATHRVADIYYCAKIDITEFEDFKASIKRVFVALGEEREARGEKGIGANHISVSRVKKDDGGLQEGVARVQIPERAFQIIDGLRKQQKGGRGVR